ncbi:MAG: radical SAM family heme chaperone HemW [Pseudomonadota bacterium]
MRNPDDTTPGFGIYVHWPFCAAKCPYCDFNSHVRHTPPDQARYGAALARELAFMATLQPNRTVTSVFFGGGTPSLMEPQTVERVLDAIGNHWQLQEGLEISLEANPTSVDAGRFEGYRRAGVNRVSLGVQALNDRDLRFLGRLHTADEARAAIGLARAVFPRMSFDLIYARPDQEAAAWEAELGEAIALSADHLSLYQLTIEEGTPFYDLERRGKLSVPPSDHAATLYERTQAVTASHGLKVYEVSNYARPGFESRHNLTYWRSGTWAAVGPGAHGRLETNRGREAFSMIRNPEAWLESVEQGGHGLTERSTLTVEECRDEMLLMGLRLSEGLDLARLEAIGGPPLNEARLNVLMEDGFLKRSADQRLVATDAGRLVLNRVIEELTA